MTPIHVVGIGLDGAAGLSPPVRALVEQAAILAGSDRHLSYFPHHRGERWPLTDLMPRLRQHISRPQPEQVVVLTSGDPLFFGLGRQLLQTLPPKMLTFHPHLSSVQLAFNRAKLPWQDATLVSAHGRSLDRLELAVKQGASPIAVLTDAVHTPGAIAQFVQTLDLTTPYEMWVCENLGGSDERIRRLNLSAACEITVSPLNVVILQQAAQPPIPESLPLLGIPDAAFASFGDRPGLLTKREVRVQIIAELALQPHQVIWDVGAGTGSVSIEIARLVPTAEVWAIEKTTVGHSLIQQNAHRFETPNVKPMLGKAPVALAGLPDPHRIFVGGSSGELANILDICAQRLRAGGRLVVALATLENLAEMTCWLQAQSTWRGQFLQLGVARSVPVGPLTRWAPLNPVILASLDRAVADS